MKKKPSENSGKILKKYISAKIAREILGKIAERTAERFFENFQNRIPESLWRKLFT